MGFISDFRIGARLGAAFAVVLSLTLALGVLAVTKIDQVNGATADLATNWLPATRTLGEYADGLNAIRRAEAQLLLSTKLDEMLAEENRLQAGKMEAAKAWKLYAPIITPGPEQPLADAIRQAEARYFSALDKVVDLAHAGDAHKPEAVDAFRSESRQAFGQLLAAVKKDIAFQNQGGSEAYAASQAVFVRTRWLVAGLVGLSLVFGGFVAWAVTRSITRPIREAVRVAETVAAGDLTAHISVDRRDETGQLLGVLQRMNENLAQMVGNVRQVSDSIATGSTQIASGNADLSQRTEEQASNLQQTAASMEQMTAAVQRNTEAARQASQLAAATAQAATQGGAVVGQVVSTMGQISDSSGKIADIIGVIDGIAFQTNILALNAAVEAARAGEQGRGFAVVAGEVRSLAGRSAEAAKQIKTLIQDSVQRVEAGSTQVANAGRVIEDIVGQVRRVHDLVSEISAASEEQSAGIGQVGDAVTQLDHMTQQNAALVEESAAAAESLRHQAAQLTQLVAQFHTADQPSLAFASEPLRPARSSAAPIPVSPANSPLALEAAPHADA